MTTGRINQVTVLRARHPQGAPHEAAGTRAHAPSPARVSHRPIQVVPPRPTPLDTPPLSGGVPSRCAALEVPSPPISHASEALPPVHRTGVGPFGGDYRRAAAPLVSRGLPERDVSPSGFLRTELAIGYQVHLPLRRSQQRQRRSAKLTLPGSSGVLFIVTHLESQATIPSQAGTSCKAGASTARPRDGQPSPQAASAGARSEHRGGVYVGHPDGPSTPGTSPSEHPNTHRRSGIGPHDGSLQGCLAAAQTVRGESKARPSHAYAESKACPSHHRHSHMATTHPPSISPRIQHPWKSCTCLCSPSM